ncbi:MAG: metallophosphatase family protein [Chloroflexota bacterium]|nr:metallophosphatase family protein [Chloroflexota bacterium]
MAGAHNVKSVAAIYDIHGNLPALDAVLADIDRLAPDLILVGGDLASGPMPRETLDRLMRLGERARFICGNSDREVVAQYDGLPQAGGDDESPFAPALAWTAERITLVQRDFLASLPEHAALEVDGLGEVLFCHGSPRSDEEIITSATPEGRLREMMASVKQDIVVCGHTHMQFELQIDGKRVINAGSVGMPYEGQTGAYWLLLGPEVSFRRTLYDVERAANQIRASGLPGAEEFAQENVLSSPPASEATAIFERMATEGR